MSHNRGTFVPAEVPYSREVATIVRDELQRLLDMEDDGPDDQVAAYVQRRLAELEAALSDEVMT